MLTAISANASLIDPATHGIPLGISTSVLAFVLSVCIVFFVVFPKKIKIVVAIVFVVTIPILIAITAGVRSDRNVAIEVTRSNISEAVQAKYGVTMLEDFYTVREGGLTPALSKEFISAKDADGKEIEVRIELTNDETDVTAFMVSALKEQAQDKS